MKNPTEQRRIVSQLFSTKMILQSLETPLSRMFGSCHHLNKIDKAIPLCTASNMDYYPLVVMAARISCNAIINQ